MSGVQVLHFWSPTCRPCQVIKPALEDLKEEFPQAEWVSVNTMNDPEKYASRYNVVVVPTLVFLKNGTEIGRHSGSSVGIYYTLLRKALSA